MTGWKELSDIVISYYNKLPKQEKEEILLFAGNYGQAGAINFYGKKYDLPEPICFNDNFLFWAPDSIENSPLIYINHEPGDIDWLFSQYEEIGKVNNRYFRENGLKVYYCKEPKDTFKRFYASKVKELKMKYY